MSTPAGPDALRAMRDRYPARTLRLDGAEWRVRDTGGTGPALLLMPGGLGNADIFYRQLTGLAPGIRCIAVDYPDASCDALADGLILLLDALAIDRGVLLGSSLAGYWLQIFGARHPDRIDALILANSFRTSTALREHPLFSIPTLSAIDGEELKQQWLARLEGREPDELRDVQISLLRHGQTGASLRHRLLSAATAPPVPRIPRGLFPLFLLDCEDDPILTASIRTELASFYPEAERLTLPIGGHYPYIAQADTYNRFLRCAVPDY